MNPELPQSHAFDAPGMNTLFLIRLRHPDPQAAATLASNCFQQLEALEADLSRFRPDSDISRINKLNTGDSMLLNEATYECLKIALDASATTAGLFDVTLGSHTQSTELPQTVSPLSGSFHLSPNRPEIICEEAGRQIDLGGIGKGFALDKMATSLADFKVQSALLSSGASTHLAFGSYLWPFHLRGDQESLRIDLSNQALSSSGIGEQGAHVIHPDTGTSPVYHFKRIWVTAPSAAFADACSTACLLMDLSEIRSFALAHQSAIKIYAEPVNDQAIHVF